MAQQEPKSLIAALPGGCVMDELVTVVLAEVRRQDDIHPGGYPATRDGVRLGLASIQDELDEALDEWRNERRMPRWTETRGELIQVVGVGLRLLRSLEAQDAEGVTS